MWAGEFRSLLPSTCLQVPVLNSISNQSMSKHVIFAGGEEKFTPNSWPKALFILPAQQMGNYIRGGERMAGHSLPTAQFNGKKIIKYEWITKMGSMVGVKFILTSHFGWP